VVAFLALSALLATTVVIFLVGLATALGRAFGPDMWWLGWLIAGGVILLGAAAALWLAIGAFLRRSGKSLVERYEAKREAQQARYGHHVRSRAADSAHTV
jgi:multisubunit Na+/H+ antiporter MnhB subunit